MSARIGTHRRLPSQRLYSLVAVLAGGLLGSAVRAWIALLLPVEPGRFPGTTLMINISGSLLLGLFLARRQRAVTRRWSLQLWGIGALGSFTTFSTFSVEVFRLLDAREWLIAVGYVLASTILGLSAAWLGQRLGRTSR